MKVGSIKEGIAISNENAYYFRKIEDSQKEENPQNSRLDWSLILLLQRNLSLYHF